MAPQTKFLGTKQLIFKIVLEQNLSPQEQTLSYKMLSIFDIELLYLLHNFYLKSLNSEERVNPPAPQRGEFDPGGRILFPADFQNSFLRSLPHGGFFSQKFRMRRNFSFNILANFVLWRFNSVSILWCH